MVNDEWILLEQWCSRTGKPEVFFKSYEETTSKTLETVKESWNQGWIGGL